MTDTKTQPLRRNLVVIGASAGGVEALKHVVARLPADLPAAVCIVLHLAPDSSSALAAILSRSGPLPCQAARDGEPLRSGQIMVAPPDRHLVVEDGHVRLTVGPRENNHRPAVDVLFRSAAEQRGQDVIGVILSGTRDDGTAGLAVIKAHGGMTIVQDPVDALYSGMPASAIANVAVDEVADSGRIADAITSMVNGDSRPVPPAPEPPDPGAPADVSTVTICPECGGVLTERHVPGTVQWECRVGHRYSPESLVEAQGVDVESALWAAVRVLEDRALLLRRMARELTAAGQVRSARRFEHRATNAEHQGHLVRSALSEAQGARVEAMVADSDADAPQESVA